MIVELTIHDGLVEMSINGEKVGEHTDLLELLTQHQDKLGLQFEVRYV